MTDALAYFSAKLAHETDPSDVYAAQRAGDAFVLVDVRSEDAWAQGHAVGAVHVPYRDIAARTAEFDPDVPVVVHCWSPGCNAGAKGAVEFAKLGFSVRDDDRGLRVLGARERPGRGRRRPAPPRRPARHVRAPLTAETSAAPARTCQTSRSSSSAKRAAAAPAKRTGRGAAGPSTTSATTAVTLSRRALPARGVRARVRPRAGRGRHSAPRRSHRRAGSRSRRRCRSSSGRLPPGTAPRHARGRWPHRAATP